MCNNYAKDNQLAHRIRGERAWNRGFLEGKVGKGITFEIQMKKELFYVCPNMTQRYILHPSCYVCQSPLRGCVPGEDSPLSLLTAHLSAGAHWGKGIGTAHEHLPAGNNQDSYIVLTLLLRWEGK